tara:strand:+ start:18 stop:728 length:711 start_codon:yes stop_codon:yes gene_type:complete
MPTTTIYATTNTTGRGIIHVSNTDWDDAVTATTGTVDSSTTNNFAVRAGAISGRGGTSYRVWRSFAYFNLSSITTTMTAATVKVYGAGSVNNGGTMSMYLSSAFNNNGTALASTDFDNVSSTLYSANSYNELTWNKSGLNGFAVNAVALSAINSNKYLNVCFRNQLEVDEEEPEDDNYLGINFQSSGTNRIHVEVTHAAAGYSNTVNSVTSANYSKINDIAKSSIERINLTPIPPP